MKIKILILIAALASPALFAQTISPVIVECGRKCSGQFTVTNNGIEPLAVVVEPFSFSLDKESGNSLFRPLDKTVEVELNDMSAKIGPRSDHTFDYKMKCGAPPCLVTLATSMVVGHTQEGMAIRVVLPHVVYQCDKAKACRANARKDAGL